MIDTAECLRCANLHAHVKLFPNVDAGGHPFLSGQPRKNVRIIWAINERIIMVIMVIIVIIIITSSHSVEDVLFSC